MYFPDYYIATMLARFAREGDEIVAVTSNSPLLSVFAARRADGSLSLLVLNKSPASAITGQFALLGFTPAAAATLYQYGIPQDNQAESDVANNLDPAADPAAQVQSGSAPIAGATFSMTFGPYSATLLSIPPAQNPSPAARLINLSGRGWVNGGTHLLVAGFVVHGSGTEQVLLRAVGPTLANFGVAGPLPDPVLRVFIPATRSSPQMPAGAEPLGWPGSLPKWGHSRCQAAHPIPPWCSTWVRANTRPR